jgi:hypothetical protein
LGEQAVLVVSSPAKQLVLSRVCLSRLYSTHPIVSTQFAHVMKASLQHHAFASQASGEAVAHVDVAAVGVHGRALLASLVALHQQRHIALHVRGFSTVQDQNPDAAGASGSAAMPMRTQDHAVPTVSLSVELLPTLFSDHDAYSQRLQQQRQRVQLTQAAEAPSGSHIIVLLTRLGLPPPRQLVQQQQQLTGSSARGSSGGAAAGTSTTNCNIPFWEDHRSSQAAAAGRSHALHDIRDDVFAIIRPTGWKVEVPDPPGESRCWTVRLHGGQGACIVVHGLVN